MNTETGAQSPKQITAVEDGGYGGWRWLTFADGSRNHVTLTEAFHRTQRGEWALTGEARVQERGLRVELAV
ncbi:hypothetical protein [Herbihabitans rhizosphaerae]|uniref:hypothetical protein n=1 Tax=Herbihabitans rhizosphaerae TaxID=1872711 RepID=UPI00102ACA64|nr:hypothetical protein [Herbihabitans rhizosphaerae]